MIDADDLRRIRQRKGLSQQELADVLNDALGKSYSGETIARWERGRPISKNVGAFLEELAVQAELDNLAAPLEGERIEPDEYRPVDEPPPGGADSFPPGPSAPAAQPRIGTGSPVWTRACVELWEMIATGIGMMGAATGSQALVMDGAIINADKEALGQAWGKLAETNETFRKMLVGMTEGGAWLQVALVTGTTVSKCWQSHGAIGLQRRMAGEYVEPDATDVAA